MTKGCVMLLPLVSLSLATKLVACAPDNNGDIKILKYTPAPSGSLLPHNWGLFNGQGNSVESHSVVYEHTGRPCSMSVVIQ